MGTISAAWPRWTLLQGMGVQTQSTVEARRGKDRSWADSGLRSNFLLIFLCPGGLSYFDSQTSSSVFKTQHGCYPLWEAISEPPHLLRCPFSCSSSPSVASISVCYEVAVGIWGGTVTYWVIQFDRSMHGSKFSISDSHPLNILSILPIVVITTVFSNHL